MIFASFAAAMLWATLSAIPVSIDRGAGLPAPDRPERSAAQNDAALRLWVQSATDCIARTVSADPHFRAVQETPKFNDLIVASVSTCVGPLRSMIDAYDRIYGEGVGNSFFMGPYLDALPNSVMQRIKAHTDRPNPQP